MVLTFEQFELFGNRPFFLPPSWQELHKVTVGNSQFRGVYRLTSILQHRSLVVLPIFQATAIRSLARYSLGLLYLKD